jgi:hypothetical protein
MFSQLTALADKLASPPEPAESTHVDLASPAKKSARKGRTKKPVERYDSKEMKDLEEALRLSQQQVSTGSVSVLPSAPPADESGTSAGVSAGIADGPSGLSSVSFGAGFSAGDPAYAALASARPSGASGVFAQHAVAPDGSAVPLPSTGAVPYPVYYAGGVPFSTPPPSGPSWDQFRELQRQVDLLTQRPQAGVSATKGTQLAFASGYAPAGPSGPTASRDPALSSRPGPTMSSVSLVDSVPRDTSSLVGSAAGLGARSQPGPVAGSSASLAVPPRLSSPLLAGADDDGDGDGSSGDDDDDADLPSFRVPRISANRFVKMAIAGIAEYGSFARWVRGQQFFKLRNEKEAVSIGRALDLLLSGDSALVVRGCELLIRRLAGVHLADQCNSNWRVAEAVEQKSAKDSFLDQTTVNGIFRTANRLEKVERQGQAREPRQGNGARFSGSRRPGGSAPAGYGGSARANTSPGFFSASNYTSGDARAGSANGSRTSSWRAGASF